MNSSIANHCAVYVATKACDRQPPPVSARVAVSPSPSPSQALLPLWIVPLMLAALTAISGTIVCVGWWVIQPTVPNSAEPESHAEVKEFIHEIARPAASAETPPGDDEVDFPSPSPANDKPVLQRRMPSGVSERLPPDLAVPMVEKLRAEAPLESPLEWKVEKPASAALNLIVPIEVAKIDDRMIPYTIRRLKFADGPAAQLRIAVTPFVYDDLGAFLLKMGAGYRYTTLQADDLFNLDTLKKYDVVFLTCAEVYARDFQAVLPLRKFVEQGGTLYASDLRGDLVLAAFPEFRASFPILPGVEQTVETSVIEKGLQSYLGRKSIPLSFDAPDWRPAAFDPNRVTVCLKGTYRNNVGQSTIAPLLVKFRVQKGSVIFTSFHHAKNDSEIVRKLLEYLVFSTVIARSEARVKDLMHRSQFAPHDQRPALLTADTPLEGEHLHSSGAMQFAVGFDSLGAKLKLTLRSPTGRTIVYQDQGLYLIEITEAERGAWHYMLTPVELPYPNFPIILAIGSPKS